MAGSSTPVGPFPAGRDPEEYDRRRRRILWSMPSGLYVLGSAGAGRRNLMTLNWATQVATDPKLVAVAVEASAVTSQLVDAGACFSVNLLHRGDRAMVRRFVKPLDPADDAGTDLLGGFEVARGVTGAPVLAAAAAWLDCRVVQRVPLGSHHLYVGEVVDCGGDAPDGLELLRMEDTRMSYGG